MDNLTCSSDMFPTNDHRRCCDGCPAGKYVRAECSDTKKTECQDCPRGSYTATRNFVTKCLPCSTSCYSYQHTVKECSATEDRHCECRKDFYCKDVNCRHCTAVTPCPVGEGVSSPATTTTNTVCLPCSDGTFSNVSDHYSRCIAHRSCQDIGRELKTPGTAAADVVCGPFIQQCSWVLPTVLWSGLVLTIILFLLGIICWRARCKSNRTGSSHVPVRPFPETHHCQAEQVFTYLNGKETSMHRPEDDEAVYCSTPDHRENSTPRTPLQSLDPDCEPSHGNKTPVSYKTYSEPQENEWCGT